MPSRSLPDTLSFVVITLSTLRLTSKVTRNDLQDLYQLLIRKPDSRRRPESRFGGIQEDWKAALCGPLWGDETSDGHIIIPFNPPVQ